MLVGMDRDEMRAGDGDRQAVAEKLKTALDEGRLDLGEYDERLQRTYSAKTYGDLQELVTDLPGTVPAQHSQVQPLAVRSPRWWSRRRAGAACRAGWGRMPASSWCPW